MSTHNIGFYEDLTKIIFELSSNIIKYAPYFFCCKTSIYDWPIQLQNDQMVHMSKQSVPLYSHSCLMRKPVFGVWECLTQIGRFSQ